MNKYLILVTAIFMISCSKKDTTVLGDYKIIPINLAQREMVDYKIFIDSIKYLKLETKENVLLSEIQKVLKDEHNIYILDNTSIIFVFDAEGKHKYSIDNVGHGPREYLKIDNITINSSKGVLEILDIHSRKILHYDITDGKYIDSYPIDKIAYAMFSISNDKYLSDLPWNANDDGKFGICLLDSNYHFLESLLEYSGDYPILTQDIGLISQVALGEYGIYSQVESSIYHLNNLVLGKKYQFDFTNKIEISSQQGLSLLEMQKSQTKIDIPIIFYYKETNKFVLLLIGEKDGAILQVVYDKIDDKAKVVKDFTEKSHPFMAYIRTDTRDVAFGAFSKVQFDFALSNDSNETGLDPQLFKLLKNSTLDDNPILQIIYLNH